MFKRSIRNKLIILLMLATVIPFGSSIIVTFLYTKESIKEQTIEENVHLLYQGKRNIETQLREMNNFILSFYNNPEFMNYLRKSFGNDALSLTPVHQVLQTMLYSDSSINRASISIVGEQKLVSVSKRSAIVHSQQADTNLEPYQRAAMSPHNLYIKRLQHTDTFIMYRAFRNVPSDEILAYITLEVKLEKFKEFSKNLYRTSGEEFYIVTPEGQFIYHSGKTIPAAGQHGSWVKALLDSEMESGTVEDPHFQGVMVFDRISDAVGSWVLVKRIPYTSLYERAYGVAFINILFGIVGLTFVILATLFISFKITSPIRVLLQSIKEVEKGNMEAQFTTLGRDEIGILGQRFKSMIEKINYLINREYKLELENKTNQLKVLQSQINPHFLYNTLQSIGTVALKHQVPQVYTSLTDLSQIMRYSMNMEEDIVPLHKEINYIKAYMLLQKQRFGDDLIYHLEVEEDVLDVLVPKMLLQPIVENYFKHGFDSREKTGKITITCKRKGNKLVISISDNGIGIDDDRLKEVTKQLHAKEHILNKESSIGLKNVYDRLKLYYSDDVVFQLHNREKGGFLVSMKLPLQMEDE